MQAARIAELLTENPILTQEPGRVFNADETPVDAKSIFNTGNAKQRAAMAVDANGKTHNPIVAGTHSDTSQHMTLILTTCANGETICFPTLILSSPKGTLPLDASKMSDHVPAPIKSELMKWDLMTTQNGYITLQLFLRFIDNLHRSARQRYPTGPLLLIVDRPAVHELTSELIADNIASLMSEWKRDKLDEAHTGGSFHVFFLAHNSTSKTQANDAKNGVNQLLKDAIRETFRNICFVASHTHFQLADNLCNKVVQTQTTSFVANPMPREQRLRGLSANNNIETTCLVLSAAWLYVSDALALPQSLKLLTNSINRSRRTNKTSFVSRGKQSAWSRAIQSFFQRAKTRR